MDTLNNAIAFLNHWGPAFCDLAKRMFIQSSVLIGLLWLADLCLRKRVSARFRYGMWLLVLAKLVLPPSLALPTGIAYWLGRSVPTASAPIAFTATPAPSTYLETFQNSAVLPVVTPEPATSAREILALQQPGLILLGWIAAVGLLLVLVLRQAVSARRSLRHSPPAERQMVDLMEQCRANLGIITQVTLRVTDEVNSPAVCGLLQPVILVPATLPSAVQPEGLRTILTHELAHIRRGDPWVNLAQIVLQVVYFWHPLVWVANLRLRHLRELAVDETVVAALRSQAQCYTDTLIDIAQMAFRKPAFSLRLIGIAESKRALERRITHMLNRRISKRPALGLSALLAIVAIGAVLLPMGRASITAGTEPSAVQAAPALPPGIAELFGLSKDAVLEKFGTPARIFDDDKTYTLDNLPETYCLGYEDLALGMDDGIVGMITLLSPRHAFGNGVRVGDAEDKVKQAFGPGFMLEETESEDYLTYIPFGASFKIHKQNRSVTEILITREYGDPARLQAYVLGDEFAAQLPAKIAGFEMDSADLKQVITTFGPPLKYMWEQKTFSPNALPERFIAMYPGNFYVFMSEDRVVELRHEFGSKYVYAGKLRSGSTLDEAIAVLGHPVKTVEGKPINWQDSANVLFKDIDGRKGHCYYHRPDRKVRVWFGDYKVAAIYMTRSDYGDSGDSSPSDPEFARLLPQRVAVLDIDSADLAQVKTIFGEPIRYVWGSQTFAADALPNQYIMTYPCGFAVYMSGGRIMEIRHESGSPYIYRGILRIGSTLQEALDLLGQPQDVVTGQKNTFKAKVLYKDIEGRQGHDYYHRPDQKVRVWFAGDKATAIYMTRSDYSDGSGEPFDPEFARVLPERVAALDIDSAGRDQVIALFGAPARYVWGNQTFRSDALPDNYIMTYPCSFSVWLQKGRIMEIRHGRGSQYAYRGRLRIGSTLQEALDLLGAPVETITGQKNEFKDGVLYCDVEGNEGQAYYHRSDQKVRVFFWEGEVIAIYMTRSDFPAGN